jgi:hypothetical protein
MVENSDSRTFLRSANGKGRKFVPAVSSTSKITRWQGSDRASSRPTLAPAVARRCRAAKVEAIICPADELPVHDRSRRQVVEYGRDDLREGLIEAGTAPGGQLHTAVVVNGHQAPEPVELGLVAVGVPPRLGDGKTIDRAGQHRLHPAPDAHGRLPRTLPPSQPG